MAFLVCYFFLQCIFTAILGIFGIFKVLNFQNITGDYSHTKDLTWFIITFIFSSGAILLLMAFPMTKDILLTFFDNIANIFIK